MSQPMELLFITCQGHYTEGAELIDSVLDVVRKEAEGCDCHSVSSVSFDVFFFSFSLYTYI